MEKKQYELCLEILRRFHKRRLLTEFILIGSWCIPFYEQYFSDPGYMQGVALRTRDIDFLIDRPQALKAKVNIPELLKDLGFIKVFQGQKGYIKLDHPDLILEFLTPERGRGLDRPFPLPSLGVNATALRFLTFLAQNPIKVKIENFFIQLPHPARFGLHKLIISPRRSKPEKAAKDRDAGLGVLRALMAYGQTRAITEAFQSVPRKGKKRFWKHSSRPRKPGFQNS